MPVPMPVMDVWVVGVAMDERRVSMPVRVGLSGYDISSVGMPVMLVMDVPMFVLQVLVGVLVLVSLGEVQR